jgi:hypothetical protein
MGKISYETAIFTDKQKVIFHYTGFLLLQKCASAEGAEDGWRTIRG